MNTPAFIKFVVTTPVHDERPVYLAGNFCDWYPDVQAYRMARTASGRYELTVPSSNFQFPLIYKFTKGSWQDVELLDNGDGAVDRVMEKPKARVTAKISHWRNNGKAYNDYHLPRIELLSPNFDMPQLGKQRRIWALLPHDYDAHPHKHYPVLYLQDAQNLWDESNPFGTWGINKSLAVLAARQRHDVIIVAIDHDGAGRIKEYSPNEGSRTGKGEARQYVRFLAETLKPYIDSRFRTMKDRAHTGIGGSSMGGLVSIYAGLMFPQVFGRLMIFSPSLWVNPRLQFTRMSFYAPQDTRIYAYAGGKESQDMLPSVKRLQDTLTNQGHDHSPVKFNLSIDPKGGHNEVRWGKEFPHALEWLFY